MRNATTAFITAVALSTTSMPAMAYQAGDMIIRAGAVTVDPNEESGYVTTTFGGLGKIGYRTGLNSDTQPGLTFTYMLTDQVGLGVLAATPFQHTLSLTEVGYFNTIEIAEIKHLPPTVTLQYYFTHNKNPWQPYVGAGINYTTFFDEKATSSGEDVGFTDFKLDDSWGYALEAGMDYSVNKNLLLSAQVWYLDIDTRANFKIYGAKSYVDVDIDPWVYMIGLGYKF